MPERVGIEVFVDPRKAEAGSRKAEKSLNSLERQADRTEKRFRSFNGAAGILGRGLAGITAALSVREVVRYADSWTNVNNKIRQVTDSQFELTKATQSVFDIAVDTRSNLEATAALYARTARKADELGISQQQVATFTKAVNQSLQAYGATAAESASATLQLSQAIGKGVLNGDEFRAVSEAAPPILKAIAEAAGVAEGALKEMGANGELTAKLIVDGILLAADKFDNDFSKSVATATSKMEVARSITTKWVGENKALTQSVSTLGDASILLANNLDVAATAGQVMLAVFAARSFGPGIASLTEMGIAASRASVQMNAYGQVVSKTTVLTRAATVATNGLKGALAFVGGPGGVAVLAASAIASYAFSVKSARDETQGFSEDIDSLLGNFDKIAQKRIENAIDERADALERNAEKARELARELSILEGIGSRSFDQQRRYDLLASELENSESAAKQLKGELKALNAELDSKKLSVDVPNIPKKIFDSKTLEKEYQRFQKRVQDKINDLKVRLAEASGDGSTLSRISVSIDQGDLNGVTGAQAQTLKNLAAQIDFQETIKDNERIIADVRGRAADFARRAEEDIAKRAEQRSRILEQLEDDLLGPVHAVNRAYERRIEMIESAGVSEARAAELTALAAKKKAEELQKIEEQKVVGFDAVFGKGSLEHLFQDFDDIEDRFKGMLARLAIEAAQAQILQFFGRSTGGKKSFTDIFGIIGKSFTGGKANGGRFGRNEIFEVNERGPEIATIGNKQFLLSNNSAGRVTPNERISQSTTKVVNSYVTVIAPDPPTFRKAESRLALDVKRKLA